MKPRTSIVLAVIAAVACIILASNRSRQIAALEGQYAALLQRASASGHAGNSAASPSQSSGRKPRADHAAEAREFIRQYQELLHAPKGQIPEQTGIHLVLSLQHRPIEQLLIILEEGGPELIGIYDRIYERLSIEAPEQFLALPLDPQKASRASHYLRMAVQKIAESDPEAAIDWHQKNPDQFKGYGPGYIIKGIAKRDHQLAFQLIEKLPPDDRSSAIHAAAIAAAETDNLSDFLPVYRAYLEKESDPEKKRHFQSNANIALVRELTHRPCAEVVESLNKAGMTPEELNLFARSVQSHDTLPNPGQWLDWLYERRHDKSEIAYPDSMIEQWTRTDHRAADAWLRAAPEGPSKQQAITAHARELATVDPDGAIEWASALTDARTRNWTYQNIHDNWPATDPEGKAAFAQEHGFAK